MEIDELVREIREIRDNHLFHVRNSLASLECSLDAVQIQLDTNTEKTIENSTNIDWLKWLIMTVGGALIITTVSLWFKR